ATLERSTRTIPSLLTRGPRGLVPPSDSGDGRRAAGRRSDTGGPLAHRGGSAPMPYKKMDMHVHSCFSSEAIPGLPRFVFSPRATADELDGTAKARGMAFVTITDHDTIEGCLDFLSRHPEVDDFIVGEEVSTRLPASGLTVHVNVYRLDERDHALLQAH